MSAPIQRLTDSNDGGGSITSTAGNGTVYANNLLVSIDGSQGSGHGRKKHKSGAWSTTGGSGTVFAHNVPVNFTGNSDTCGHARSGGSSNVFVGSTVDFGGDAAALVMFDLDDIEPNEEKPKIVNRPLSVEPDIVYTPQSEGQRPEVRPVVPNTTSTVQTKIEQAISQGKIKRDELITGPITPTAEDTKRPATTSTAKIVTNCADIHNNAPYADNWDKIRTIKLSNQYTVGSIMGISTKPKRTVTADNELKIPIDEILCNLKLVVMNIIEPIREKYPDLLVTSTFRNDSTSQHGRGQAVDMQFRRAKKEDYFTIAQWVKDNIKFDQLLLEYKTVESGLPWIHCSFNKDNNRKQIFTFMNDVNWKAPGHFGLFQLAHVTPANLNQLVASKQINLAALRPKPARA